MKHVVTALVVFGLLVGCSESVAPSCFKGKISKFDDSESVVPSCYKEKISEFDDVDAFVCWLEEQPGVTEVSINKKLLLTSAPPQVVISFLFDGGRRTLPLLVEPDRKLKLVSPEQHPVP